MAVHAIGFDALPSFFFEPARNFRLAKIIWFMAKFAGASVFAVSIAPMHAFSDDLRWSLRLLPLSIFPFWLIRFQSIQLRLQVLNFGLEVVVISRMCSY